MRQIDYLRLIIDAFLELDEQFLSFEAGNGIMGDESMIALRKDSFKKNIIRSQKKAYRDNFVTKEEFLRYSHVAVHNLKEHIYFNAFWKINELNDYKKSITDDVLFKKVEKEIKEFDIETYSCDLSSFEGTLSGIMCFEDVEFIESIFDDFNFDDEELKPESEAVDLSLASATQKIIYLQTLGVIDFLMSKHNISINGLATVLSAITGEKVRTIQPMVNPIISKMAGQKNNPFNSKNTVKKVKAQLIQNGFNLPETI